MRAEDTDLTARLATQLRRDEGFVEHAYQDHLGYWTIGVGRLIDERKGGRITEAEALHLLGNDIAEKSAELHKALPWIRGLSDARRGALLNMAFQLGVSGLLGFQQTLSAIRDEHYDHAADLMLLSKWAKQTPARAKRMSRQIATGEWQ